MKDQKKLIKIHLVLPDILPSADELRGQLSHIFDGDSISFVAEPLNDEVFDFPDLVIFPGFCDVHVHFREPGFSYKETILTGSRAAAHGGFTDVCAMPNLSPVPDSLDHLKEQLSLIDRDAVIGVHPFGSITVKQLGDELSDMTSMAPLAVGFSDDGKGVQSADMMRQAMIKAASLSQTITAHCEVNDLLYGGCVHDGEFARSHGYPGICSESEWKQIERDIELARETGCRYHVCHISCKESVDLIRKAKAEGVDVTCETCPHYLLMDEQDLKEEGRFKMNPPIRSREDREALIKGIQDGTIDMIVTDHAPHSEEEKSRGLKGSPFGVVGIETSFALCYTYLVKTGIISMERLMQLMVTAPRNRFRLSNNNAFTLWNLSSKYRIDPKSFLSKGKSTPFEGWEVYGECLMTVSDGKIAYIKED